MNNAHEAEKLRQIVRALQDAYRAGLAPHDEAARTLVTDTWFQAAVLKMARNVVRDGKGLLHWTEDAAQSAIVVCLRSMHANIKFSQRFGCSDGFGKWLRWVIRLGCLRTVHNEWKHCRISAATIEGSRCLTTECAVVDEWLSIDLRLDVDAAIERLSPLQRQLMRLVRDGHTLSQAGRTMGISRRRARCRFEKAAARLRWTLRDYLNGS